MIKKGVNFNFKSKPIESHGKNVLYFLTIISFSTKKVSKKLLRTSTELHNLFEIGEVC